MPTLVIYNPACGDRTAAQFFSAHVLPLLHSAAIAPAAVHATTHPGHAAALVAAQLDADPAPLTVVLGSGDGTLHEIIEALTNTPPAAVRAAAAFQLAFALVPCGTANALYAALFPPAPADDPTEYRLRSLRALLAAPAAPARPLALALTTLVPPPRAAAPAHTAVSAVVASTALHASILADSEALRASDPSLARFHTAAAQNIARWYAAAATLLPLRASGAVERWDPAARAFAPHPHGTPTVDVPGPFAYFLSVVNVDRLEPAFRIAPAARVDPPRGAALDVVIVRPRRDPAVELDSDETRAAFAEKLKAVLGAAYQDGAHLLLRYAEDGSLTTEGDGPLVVEYVRCGGWEWEPDAIDDKAHLVCADGDIHEIPKGGKATCNAVAPKDENSGFAVYV